MTSSNPAGGSQPSANPNMSNQQAQDMQQQIQAMQAQMQQQMAIMRRQQQQIQNQRAQLAAASPTGTGSSGSGGGGGSGNSPSIQHQQSQFLTGGTNPNMMAQQSLQTINMNSGSSWMNSSPAFNGTPATAGDSGSVSAGSNIHNLPNEMIQAVNAAAGSNNPSSLSVANTKNTQVGVSGSAGGSSQAMGGLGMHLIGGNGGGVGVGGGMGNLQANLKASLGVGAGSTANMSNLNANVSGITNPSATGNASKDNAMLLQQLQYQQLQQMSQQAQQIGQPNSMIRPSSGTGNSNLGLGFQSNTHQRVSPSNNLSLNLSHQMNASSQLERQNSAAGTAKLGTGASNLNLSHSSLGGLHMSLSSGQMSASNSLQNLQPNIGMLNRPQSNDSNHNQQFPVLGGPTGSAGGTTNLMQLQQQQQQQLLAIQHAAQAHAQKQAVQAQQTGQTNQGVSGMGMENAMSSLRRSFTNGNQSNLLPGQQAQVGQSAGIDAGSSLPRGSFTGGNTGSAGNTSNTGNTGGIVSSRGSFSSASQPQSSSSQMMSLLSSQQQQQHSHQQQQGQSQSHNNQFSLLQQPGSQGMYPPVTGQVSLSNNVSSASEPTQVESSSSSGEQNEASTEPNQVSKTSSDSISNGGGNSASPELMPNFAGGWQSNADYADRRLVIVNIVKIIERMRPDANKLANRLPLMAKKLEEHLYRSAATKAEYTDPASLKKRLQLIAHRLGLGRSPSVGPSAGSSGGGDRDNDKSSNTSKEPTSKSKKKRGSVSENKKNVSSGSPTQSPTASVGVTKNPQDKPISASSGNIDPNTIFPTSSSSSTPSSTAAMMKMNLLQTQLAQQQQLLQQAQSSGISSGCNGGKQTQNEALLQQLQLQQSQTQSLLNEQLQKNMQQAHNQPQPGTGQQGQLNSSGNTSGGNAGVSVGIPQLPSMSTMLKEPSQPTTSSNLPQPPPSASRQPSFTSITPSDSATTESAKQKRKLVVRQQQQRLLLLRHASKCTAGANCKTQFCGQMVKLWQHMKKCRDKNCQTAHCLSSRCVLNHYRICKGENRTKDCEVCAPVMKQIKSRGGDVDLMEQLAKEQAEQDAQENYSSSGVNAGDSSGTGGTGGNNLGNTLLNTKQGGNQMAIPSSSSSLPPAQVQYLQMQAAFLQQQQQQQQQQGNDSTKSQQQAHSQSQQQGNNQNQMTSQNIPLSQHQHQQQQAFIQQLQAHQQNILLQQLQRKSIANLQGGTTQDGKKTQQQATGSSAAVQSKSNESSANAEARKNSPAGTEDASVSNETTTTKQPTVRKRRSSAGGRKRKPATQDPANPSPPQSRGKVIKKQAGKGTRICKPKKAATANNAPNPTDGWTDPQGMTDSFTSHSSTLPTTASASDTAGSTKGKQSKRNSLAKKVEEKSTPGDGGATSEATSNKKTRVSPSAPNVEDAKISPGSSLNASEATSTDEPKKAKVKKEPSPSQVPSLSNDKKQGKEKDAEVKKEVTAKAGKSSPHVASKKLEKKPGINEAPTSLISSMKTEDIEQHLESLHDNMHLTPRRIAQKCLPIITKLLNDPYGWVFKDPVDPVELGIPDYFNVVENPMDLSLVKKKLENGIYKELERFESDTKLVFENCILYNGADSDVGDMAKDLLALFSKEYKLLLKGMKTEQQQQKRKGDICILCGNSRKQFEPTVLYCNGACGMQRIRRTALYYTDPRKQNHWCVPCYGLLQESDPILLDDGNEISKKDLQKLKNDALAEEAWVECDECHSWVHQVCALFNGRKNKTSASYSCPKCHFKKRVSSSYVLKSVPCAKDLPHCSLSHSLENGLLKVLDKAYKEKARMKNCSVDEVEKAGRLCIRVVSNMEKKHMVRDEMYKRYQKQGFPSEFPVRTKCILLFQSIHGVDILLFGMYVYEYDHDCPAPNRRRVYISYLDSVNYFQPRCYRTLTYQTIIVEYLRVVKERGFHTAHIWSCPPSKGDDYIFHCHPSQQKTPRDDMLCAWYHKMLDLAKAEGIVLKVKSLYDEYFKPDVGAVATCATKEPSCIPYFEGDYVPGEVENIIKELDGEEKARRKEKDPNPKACGGKPAGKKKGTRSNPGELVNTGPDKVMLRLGQALSNMKQNFMVAHLRTRSFAAAVERGDDVSNWVEDDHDESKMRRSGKDASILGEVRSKKGDGVMNKSLDADELSSSPCDDQAEQKRLIKGETKGVGSGVGGGKMKHTKKGPVGTRARRSKSKAASKPPVSTLALINKNDTLSLAGSTTKKLIGSTTDMDPPQESELFDSRQLFLNCCTLNHFQFDELRRAKHATMMVLFHLHNPSAPKFLQQCGSCYREITHGMRYHCNNCSNFDLCQECYEPVVTGLWAQRDSRFAHDSSHVFTQIDMEAVSDTQKSREERDRSIKLHLELLQHCATCKGAPSCSSHNCQRMRSLFDHLKTCKVSFRNGCKICSRFLALLCMHARQCSVRGSARCPVPHCDRIRERNHRLRQQQQLMDDRRRNAQNELYRAGRAQANGSSD